MGEIADWNNRSEGSAYIVVKILWNEQGVG
jgi:hypothetical protein